MNKLLSLIFLIFSSIIGVTQSSDCRRDFYYFPGKENKWQLSGMLGVSVSKLPNNVVEEEINTSPMLNGAIKLSLPKNFEIKLDLGSNYFTNKTSSNLQWGLSKGRFSFAIGFNFSVWFGSYRQGVIQLRSLGYMGNPYISAGFDFNDFLLSIAAETQYGYMKTYSDDAVLARINQANSAYSIQFAIEQPLWNNHWVAIGTKLNYAKFYYQAWLTYSAVDEFLLYPEFFFSFLL